jgi:hypothetical protein
MAKAVRLSNGRAWKTTTAALEHFKATLHRYGDGDVISDPGDHDDLGALLERYDACGHGGPTKIGCGIDHFERRANFVDGCKTSGFWVVRTDGSDTDFSYIYAVKGQPKSADDDFRDACRDAVAADLKVAAEQFFQQHADAEGRVLCPLTKEFITRDEAHLDHAHTGFSQIVEAYRAARKWSATVPPGIVSTPADGQLRAEFVDAATREDFRSFHHALARIRVVKAKANLARAASQRVPKIAQPVVLPIR